MHGEELRTSAEAQVVLDRHDPEDPQSPKGHTNRRILHSGSKAQDKGIPETMICRILCLRGLLGPYQKLE